LPDLQGKIGDLTQLANAVLKLDAGGYKATEMVKMLFDGEPRLTLWTMGHFSATNLIEACRSYNAIIAPFDGSQSPAPAARPGRPDDLTDSSTKRSSDPDDIRR
jgi:hypothetical protein